MKNYLRGLGAVYAIAFISFGVQAAGLIGSRGILPFPELLDGIRKSYGVQCYWLVPSLLWLVPSDLGLASVWLLGTTAALVAVWGRWQKPALLSCFLLWVSICAAGQDFLSFQWDVLLLEAGFLALFADTQPVRVWLHRWLIFRLMFFSGVVKLISHDPTWAHLTALDFHFETQPLPVPLAWYVHHWPAPVHRLMTSFTLIAELAVPFLFLTPWRQARRAGAYTTLVLQVCILLTGNYAFFNLLTMLLTVWLFVEPEAKPTTREYRLASAAVAGLIAFTSALLTLQMFGVELPDPGVAMLRAVAPLHIVNPYGLFAVMTTTRPEIVIEASMDGEHWFGYELPYKPGDIRRAPPLVAPHQPRLDWQLWFAALGSYRENRWFAGLMLRLLEGEPAVLRLFAYNPFPHQRPKYVRASLYKYTFSKRGDSAWWQRERLGEYFPAVGMK